MQNFSDLKRLLKRLSADYTVTMPIFSALGVVAVVMAVGLKLADRGADSHGLELPSAEAAALNEAR